jgi:hypothetical protein
VVFISKMHRNKPSECTRTVVTTPSETGQVSREDCAKQEAVVNFRGIKHLLAKRVGHSESRFSGAQRKKGTSHS